MNIVQITTVVSQTLSIPIEQIDRKGDRKPLHVLGRHMTWTLITHFQLDYTVIDMGNMFGVDHSTISDGRKSLMKKMQHSSKLRIKFQEIVKLLETT